MPQHIGIVACSAEGAALCYRTICVEGAPLLFWRHRPAGGLVTARPVGKVGALAQELKFLAGQKGEQG